MMYQYPMWWMQFDYQACAFGCWNGNEDERRRPGPGPLNLRCYFAETGCLESLLITPFVSVSRSLRDEFGDYMIGSREFMFRCPASFAEFTHKLSSSQIASLRRITFDLFGPEYDKGCQKKIPDPAAWASALRDLPSGLASLSHVAIWIGESAPSYLLDPSKPPVRYHDDGGEVGTSSLPLFGIDTVAKITEIICKGIHRVAPEAWLFIPGTWIRQGSYETFLMAHRLTNDT